MIVREERIGGQRLILGDCAAILPTLERVDLLLVDPPFGIGAENHAGPEKSGWTQWEGKKWDKERPAPEVFAAMRKASKEQIIWGGNYFADLLPPTMRWLIWDKGQRDFSLADCEVAWTSQNKAMRIFNYARAKALQDGKEHPTQKPVALMQWCLGFFPNAKTVLDCYMGSGTTLYACQKMGRNGIGIEIDPDYFDIACRRVDEAARQPDLLIDTPQPKGKQEALDL